MAMNTTWTRNYTDAPKAQMALVDSVAVIFLPTVISIGIVGNTLVILVFRHSRATKAHSGNVAFVAICVMDTLTLLFGITWQFLRLHTRYISRLKRSELFESPQYAAYLTCMYLLEPWTVAAGTWIECYLSIARFTAVYWPHRSRLLFGYKRTSRAIITIIALALVIRIPIWLVELQPLGINEEVRSTMRLLEPVVTFVMRLLVPTLIITVTTIGIIRALKISRRQFAEPIRAVSLTYGEMPSGNMAAGGYAPAGRQRKNSSPCLENSIRRHEGSQRKGSEGGGPWNFNLVRVTFVLVGKNVSYFIFLTTYVLIDLIFLATGKNQRSETLITAYALSYMLSYVHHSSSLFICLAGGRRFRQQTARLCGCGGGFKLRRSRTRNKQNPIPNKMPGRVRSWLTEF